MPSWQRSHGVRSTVGVPDGGAQASQLCRSPLTPGATAWAGAGPDLDVYWDPRRENGSQASPDQTSFLHPPSRPQAIEEQTEGAGIGIWSLRPQLPRPLPRTHPVCIPWAAFWLQGAENPTNVSWIKDLIIPPSEKSEDPELSVFLLVGLSTVPSG